jgi:hypothetical protein
MAYISTASVTGILSWCFFGRFLAVMIGSHDDVPVICAAYCK